MPFRNMRDRRSFRFSMRTLLASLVVAAIPLAWIGNERRQSRREREIAGRVVWVVAGHVTYGGPYDSVERVERDQPQDLIRAAARYILGERVVELAVQVRDSDTYSLRTIGELKSLRELRAKGIKDSNLAPLASLTNLRCLMLRSAYRESPISDLNPLSGLQQLRNIQIQADNVCDVSPLAKLTKLELLGLWRCKATDYSPLVGLKNLKELQLDGSQICDVSPLTALANVESLSLDHTSLDDISPLAQLVKLTRLSLKNTTITAAQVERLRSALPNCQIEHGTFP